MQVELDISADSSVAFPTAEELAAWLPQYDITARLSTGAHSAVYVGRQPALERQVMLRILAEPGPEMAQSLMQRLRIRARLVHPRIVSVFDFGRTSSGALYLVTEHVDGSLLCDLIQSGQVTPKDAYQFAAQLCESLQVVHDQEAVHGTLSTRTVLVSRDRQVKITGIGMSELADGELTWLGDFHGSVPEDIRALGCVVHEMFTGLPPGPDGELSSALPASFAAVIARCLHPDPEQRFGYPLEIRAGLAEALRAEKAVANRASPAPVAPTHAATGTSPGGPVPARPAAPQPPRAVPGRPYVPHYQAARRPGLMRRIDNFLWSALRASLHFVIFGATLAIIAGYVLLKDKIVISVTEEDSAPPPATTPAQVAPAAKPPAVADPMAARYRLALEEAAAAAREDGRREEARALERELRRINDGGPVPLEDDADTPPLLKQLRQQFRQS